MWKWQNQVRTKERSIEVSQHHHQDCEYCSGYHHLAAASERARAVSGAAAFLLLERAWISFFAAREVARHGWKAMEAHGRKKRE